MRYSVKFLQADREDLLAKTEVSDGPSGGYCGNRHQTGPMRGTFWKVVDHQPLSG